MFALGNQFYGSTYVHYHEPVSVKAFFGGRANRFQHAHEPAHVQQLTKNELELVQELAEFVIDQQQRFIVVQTFNLVAVYLSYRSQREGGLEDIDFACLCDQTLVLARLFGRMGAVTNVDPSRIRDQMEGTLKTHEALLEKRAEGSSSKVVLMRPSINTHATQSVKFKAHRLGDDTMTQCLPLVSLQLYVNPCLYWTALPALTLAALRRLHSHRSFVKHVTVDALRAEVNSLRQIFSTEFVFIASKDATDFESSINILRDFNLLEVDDQGLAKEPVKAGDDQNFGDVLISTVTPYLWTYLQVLKTTSQYFPSISFTENSFMSRVQSCVEEQLRKGGAHVHPYCLCLEAISTALSQFTKLGIFAKSRDPEGTVNFNADMAKLHALHCHLQHLCDALNFSLAIDKDDGVKLLMAKL